jgi:hypothetical protein
MSHREVGEEGSVVTHHRHTVEGRGFGFRVSACGMRVAAVLVHGFHLFDRTRRGLVSDGGGVWMKSAVEDPSCGNDRLQVREVLAHLCPCLKDVSGRGATHLGTPAPSRAGSPPVLEASGSLKAPWTTGV